MRVLLPLALALLAFMGWIWLTGPGTNIFLALTGLAVSAVVLVGSARLINGRSPAAETGNHAGPSKP
jgi:hypothetical protein